jgi:poly(3-hydroxybutyrate) depolymerase
MFAASIHRPFACVAWILGWTLLASSASAADAVASQAAVASLEAHLKSPAEGRAAVAGQLFSHTPLTREDAQRAAELLWLDHAARLRLERAEEMRAGELQLGERKMPFALQRFGEKPAGGRSLYISMHGGGNAPARVNDRQWENQKQLYKLEEGVYVAPRAPTNTWNLWHEAHIDKLFDRLIENLIVFEEVDPNRVYLLGYSAGGDGVYQLAPRMADRLAAAAMMAGHPNETSPLGLRNLPFTIHVGGLDTGYKRNDVAREWEKKLAELHKADHAGYTHLVQLHEGKPHWMDREDAVAIPWMAKHTRKPLPEKIVWKQDDVTHTRFYWLAADAGDFTDRAEIVARRDGQTIELESKGFRKVTVRVSDKLCDLDQPVTISAGGKTLFTGRLNRTIAVLAKTLAERGDPQSVYCSNASVELPPTE